ncbi:procathepsin L-like [Crassostrea virginica]
MTHIVSVLKSDKMRCYHFLFLVSFMPLVSSSGELFQSWKQHYGKHYRNIKEEQNRYAIWRRNLELVERHNKLNSSAFLMEMNRFADQLYIGHRIPLDHKTISSETIPTRSAPDSFDWRKKGAISPVKNQGQMGRPAVFATVDSIESMHFIKSGQLVELSIQEMAQCCNASFLTSNFECVKKLGGLCSTASYPDSRTCQSQQCTPVAMVTGAKQVKTGDEQDLKLAVYTQPVVAAIDASHASFQLYRSGVYYEPACSSQRLDHAILVVGYGSQAGKDFWIVKNSWGVDWGMEGYILMSRNRGNNCGIATTAEYPVGT